ncbi:MAG: hypothetical protein ABJB66_12405 [Gemmatimonadaceae bacterium]
MNALETTDFDDSFEPTNVGAAFAGDEGAPDFEDDEEAAEEIENVVPVRVSDERANVPVSEVAERFLKAILAKVPLDRIEELHMFSPLRQGTIETGIAVVAARVILLPVTVAQPLHIDVVVAGTSDADPIELATELIDPIVVDSTNEDEMIAVEIAVEEAHTDIVVENFRSETGDVDSDGNFVLASDEVELAQLDGDEDSPYADANVVALDELIDQMIVEEFIDEESTPSEPVNEMAPEPPRIRHTVYTARYRLVIKGPERGRWETDVVDEADAPLLTVETVVRGVQRRAGEDTATVRYTAAQIARALHIDAPSIQ